MGSVLNVLLAFSLLLSIISNGNAQYQPSTRNTLPQEEGWNDVNTLHRGGDYMTHDASGHGFYNYRYSRLCGPCVETDCPPVYSYYPQGVRCGWGTNWLKYLATYLLPPTAFFLVLITFRLSATSPIVSGFIVISQILTSSSVMRRVELLVFNTIDLRALSGYGADVYFAVFGIWNSDLLALFYSPLILNPSATEQQVLSLDYIIPFYPLVLIMLTYTLVRLHYNNCRVVVWLLRPFIGCFARCRRQWDILNSLVDAFATFLLLFYVKFLSVSYDIIETYITDRLAAAFDNKQIVYYEGTRVYLEWELAPYALLTVISLVTFTFLPAFVLCIYPCQCFQKLLNHFGILTPLCNKLIKSLQSFHKSIIDGTRQCRYLAATFMMVRVAVSILPLAMFSIYTESLFHPNSSWYQKLDFILAALLIIFVFVVSGSCTVMFSFMLSIDRLILLLFSLSPILCFFILPSTTWYLADRARAVQERGRGSIYTRSRPRLLTSYGQTAARMH